MLHLLWSVIVGFLAGLFARAVTPGADHFGFLATTGIGIAGSLIGGFVARLLKPPPEGAKFHPAGFFMSVAGAVLLLLLLRAVQ